MAESRRGKKWDEAAKAKMRVAKLGKKQTEEHRRKAAAAKMGHPVSEETREKLRQRAKERDSVAAMHTPEANAKRDASIKAKLTGIPRSEEVKAKVSASKRANPYIYPEEVKRKMSAAAKARYEQMTPEERREMFANFIQAGQEAAKTFISDTGPERIVEEFLNFFGKTYEKQKRIGLCTVDFFLPDESTVVEVMGCYWHACEQCGYTGEKSEVRRQKDRKRKEFLESQGFKVQCIWEHELLDYIDKMHL